MPLRINEDSKFALGAKRIINKEYLKLTILLLIIIAKSIEEKAKEFMAKASR